MVEEEESWVGQGRRTTWGLLQGNSVEERKFRSPLRIGVYLGAPLKMIF
jgi:hypothetical protein